MNYLAGDTVRMIDSGVVGEIRKHIGAGRYEVWMETAKTTKIIWDNEIELVSLSMLPGEHADAQSRLMMDVGAEAGVYDNGSKPKKTRWVPSKSRHLHWRDPFELESGLFVYGSGRMTKGNPKAKPVPTAGVYLDQSWMQDFGTLWTTSKMPEHIKPKHDILILRWPDRGVIPVWDLSVGVVWAIEKARAGEIVDVACLGSHGRTGTFMAAMLIYMGRTPGEAIAQVRKGHCERAIETDGQEKLVERLYTARKGN